MMKRIEKKWKIMLLSWNKTIKFQTLKLRINDKILNSYHKEDWKEVGHYGKKVVFPDFWYKPMMLKYKINKYIPPNNHV